MDQTSKIDFLNHSLLVASKLTSEEKLHLALMEKVLKHTADLPFIFKGGSALLFCYGLNRFSEDLDFDCAKRINPKSCIVEAIKDLNSNASLIKNTQRVNLITIDVPKDTETTSRYMIRYAFTMKNKELFKDFLKVEISHRNELISTKNFENFVNKDKAFNVYKLEYLLENKLICIGAYPEISAGRSKIRDLYDVAFISEHYPDIFSAKQTAALSDICRNMNKLTSQFEYSYREDKIVKKITELDDLVLKLAENSEKLTQRSKNLSLER